VWLPTDSELLAERLRRRLTGCFPAFIEHLWSVVEPTPYVEGWHFDLMAEAAVGMVNGLWRVLVVNAPPRHGKSLIFNVFLVPWVWLTRPTARFLYVSYGTERAIADSLACRRVIESQPYQYLFGSRFQLRRDLNTRDRFGNDQGGMRIATSLGGSATGEGADYAICDDPHKLEDMRSPSALRTTCDDYMAVIPSRLNDPKNGGMAITHQRVATNDLSARARLLPGAKHVCLPLAYDPRHPHLCPDDPRTEPDEPLWPARYGQREIELMMQQSAHPDAQLQQNPQAGIGEIVDVRRFRYYREAELPQRFDMVCMSCDLTFAKSATRGDYVVLQVWAAVGEARYLLNQRRGRWKFTRQLDEIRALTAWTDTNYPTWKGHKKLVEDATNASAVIDLLEHEISGFDAIPVHDSKPARLEAVAPTIESGLVNLPGVAREDGSYDRLHTPAWVTELVDEIAAFPGPYDDQVDALTQALIWLRHHPRGPRVRFLGFN